MDELLALEHGVTLQLFVPQNRIYVMVEDQEGCSQFPIMYSPRGDIGYDFPENVSEEQKKEVRRAFNMMCPPYWEVKDA